MTSTNLPESNTSLTYTQPSTPPHLTHAPISAPGPQEILVKIKAAAINPVDIQLWGNPVIGWLAGKKEKGIGRDYSGEIVAIGEALKKDGKWEVGDEVYGLCSRPTAEGTFTQYLTLQPADAIAKKPSTLTHTQAAAIPLVALTAFECLNWLPTESQSPNSPRRVVVSGASGGVGSWCVQLAKKLYKCHVTGICSGGNADFVKELGADEVVDYTKQDVAKALLAARPSEKNKFDLYIDCVGGTGMFDHWYDLLHASGAYITIVGDKTDRASLGGPPTYFTNPSQILRHIRGYLFGPRYANVVFAPKSELLEQVTHLADRGDIKVEVQDVVQGVLSEEGHQAAWEKVKEYMIEGRVRGKIVVGVA